MQVLRSLLNSGVFMVLLVVAVSVYLAYSEQIHSSLEELEVTTSSMLGQSDDATPVASVPVVQQEENRVSVVEQAVAATPVVQQEVAPIVEAVAAEAVASPVVEAVAEPVVAEAVSPVAADAPAVTAVSQQDSVATNEISWPVREMPAMPPMPELAPMSEMPAMPAMPELAPMSEMPAMPVTPELAPMSEMPAMPAMPELAPMSEMPAMPPMPELAPMSEMPAMPPMPELAPMSIMSAPVMPMVEPVQQVMAATPAQMDVTSALEEARRAFHAGNLDEAEARYRAILSTSDNPDAFGELGNIFFARRQFSDANDAYLKAAEGLIAQNRLLQAQYVIGVLMNSQPEYAQQAMQAFNAKLQSQR